MRAVLFSALLLLGACQSPPESANRWFSDRGAIKPDAAARKVWICHGFGCHYRDTVTFGQSDIRAMRRIMGRPRSAAQERRRIKRLVSWSERRVAPVVGSAGDVGGLDMQNARKRGQMDCIDEATNTTSVLTIAKSAGLLRFHAVGGPVSRGFFLDGRYPHATAVIKGPDGDFAVDSWPQANGVPPDVLPLDVWFARSPAR